MSDSDGYLLIFVLWLSEDNGKSTLNTESHSHGHLNGKTIQKKIVIIIQLILNLILILILILSKRKIITFKKNLCSPHGNKLIKE